MLFLSGLCLGGDGTMKPTDKSMEQPAELSMKIEKRDATN